MSRPETTRSDSRSPSAGRSPCSDAALAAERVVGLGGRPGRLGLVLGTGLGGLAQRLEDRCSIGARETRFLPESRATGHAGKIVTGRIGGGRVVALQGRVHGYEGFDRDTLSRGVELLAALGVTTVIVTNASGGLCPGLEVGELVVMEDHVDLVRIAPAALAGAAAVAGAPERIGRMHGSPYDPGLIDVALTAARRAHAPARRGVYGFLSGPSYETRAEYRMLRRIGADVVGMSTVPEVVAAMQLGMRVLAVSVVTNVARPDAALVTDAEDVCQAAGDAAEGVWAILAAVAATMEGDHATAPHE